MPNDVELEKVSKSVFGISSRRYRQLANEEIVPQPIRGKIDFVAATKALIEYYRKLAESQGSLSLTDERTALTAIKKEREMLKLETEKGNLIPKDQSITWLSTIVNEARIALMGLARRLAPMLVGLTDVKEIEWKILGEIKKVLAELSKPLKKRK